MIDVKAEDFIGLTKKSCQDKCEARNLIFRLLKKDGEEFFPPPEDKRTDRVCVEILAGKVVKADIN